MPRLKKKLIKSLEKAQSISLTHKLHDCSLCWIGTGDSIKMDRVKLDLLAQIAPVVEMMRM
jgi:hypothetical protein